MKPDKQFYEKYFQQHSPTVHNIIKLAKFCYETASAQNGKLLSTDYFLKTVRAIAVHLNMTNEQIQSIQFKLYDVVKAYRIRGGQTVRVASLAEPIRIRQIIRDLWTRTHSTAIRPRPLPYEKRILRKVTAVQTLLVSVTGRRWIDIARLRWEFAKIIHLDHATVIKIGIFISKPNKKGRRNESITLVKDSTDLCPVEILIKFWIQMGKPKTGWIFPCIHKDKIFKKNSFCEEWSSWCCSGHRRSKQIIECLGHINGENSQKMLGRAAIKVGFRKPPTRHTFRRILVVMATKLGMNRERICEHFGWNYDSHMISHYLQDTLGTDRDGLPCQISKNILNEKLFKDIPMPE